MLTSDTFGGSFNVNRPGLSDLTFVFDVVFESEFVDFNNRAQFAGTPTFNGDVRFNSLVIYGATSTAFPGSSLANFGGNVVQLSTIVIINNQVGFQLISGRKVFIIEGDIFVSEGPFDPNNPLVEVFLGAISICGEFANCFRRTGRGFTFFDTPAPFNPGPTPNLFELLFDLIALG